MLLNYYMVTPLIFNPRNFKFPEDMVVPDILSEFGESSKCNLYGREYLHNEEHACVFQRCGELNP